MGKKLLIGGPAITESILKKPPTPQEIRWFYGQVPNLAGVVWQLAEDGIFYAYEEDLAAHFETKAAEAKASALAAAEVKAAEKRRARNGGLRHAGSLN
jgi:hypothetical protein